MCGDCLDYFVKHHFLIKICGNYFFISLGHFSIQHLVTLLLALQTHLKMSCLRRRHRRRRRSRCHRRITATAITSLTFSRSTWLKNRAGLKTMSSTLTPTRPSIRPRSCPPDDQFLPIHLLSWPSRWPLQLGQLWPTLLKPTSRW